MGPHLDAAVVVLGLWYLSFGVIVGNYGMRLYSQVAQYPEISVIDLEALGLPLVMVGYIDV